MFPQEVKGHQELKVYWGKFLITHLISAGETLRDGFVVCSWFVCQHSSSGTISYLKDWKKKPTWLSLFASLGLFPAFLDSLKFGTPDCAMLSLHLVAEFISHTHSLHRATLTPFNLA